MIRSSFAGCIALCCALLFSIPSSRAQRPPDHGAGILRSLSSLLPYPVRNTKGHRGTVDDAVP